MKLFGNTIESLEHALDVRLEKQNRLASNIANLDTPGYKPKDVDFEASMEAFDRAQTPESESGPTAMRTTSAGHLGPNGEAATRHVPAVVADDLTASPTLDDNSVDLDHTMAELAENSTQYSAVTKILRKKLALLRYVASDGAA